MSKANKCKLQTVALWSARPGGGSSARNSQVVSHKKVTCPSYLPSPKKNACDAWVALGKQMLRLEKLYECVRTCRCVCAGLAVNGKYIYDRNYTLKFKLYQQTETACSVHCHDSISECASWSCGWSGQPAHSTAQQRTDQSGHRQLARVEALAPSLTSA